MQKPRRVIAIVNPKGGSGKTTLTLNLAACLSSEGYGVEVLDTDTKQKTLWKICTRSKQSFHIRALDNETHYASLSEKFSSSRGQSDKKEYLLIDTASGLNTSLLKQVLIDSDLVLVPFIADVINIDILEELYKLALELSRNEKLDLKIRLLPREGQPEDLNFYRVMGAYQEEINPFIEDSHLDIKIWSAAIPHSFRFDDARNEMRSHVFSNEDSSYEGAKHIMRGISLKSREEIEATAN